MKEIIEQHFKVAFPTHSIEVEEYMSEIRIDIDTAFLWGSLDKKEYEKQESFLEHLITSKPNYDMSSFYDISGYEFWMEVQKEPNFFNIIIKIKETFNISEVPSLIEEVKLWFDMGEKNLKHYEF